MAASTLKAQKPKGNKEYPPKFIIFKILMDFWGLTHDFWLPGCGCTAFLPVKRISLYRATVSAVLMLACMYGHQGRTVSLKPLSWEPMTHWSGKGRRGIHSLAQLAAKLNFLRDPLGDLHRALCREWCRATLPWRSTSKIMGEQSVASTPISGSNDWAVSAQSGAASVVRL